MGKPDKCQGFTALGRVLDENTCQVQISENFCPSRRTIEYLPCSSVSILPLIEQLDFIPNKKSWGYPFRFGILEINKKDFDYISSKMLSSHSSHD